MDHFDDAQIARLQQVLLQQSAEHAMLLLDLDARILWANDTAGRILGATPQALRGRALAEFFTPGERALGIDEGEIDIARAGSVSEDDRWQQRADGSRFWASGALIPLHDDAGTLIAFGKIFRNRTDTRLHMDTLRNQVEALSTHERQRNDFLAGLAHELRNPLAPMLSTCHTLRAINPAPDVQHAATLIERQVELLSRLTDDLLDATLLASDRIHLDLQSLAISAVLRDAADTMHDAIGERGHQIDLLLASDDLKVYGDRPRLQQVFVNLLSNAVKFTPAGGRIRLKCTKEGGEAVARVEDDGIGLAPDEREHIFRMFARAAPADGTPGMGVGLAVVKTLVERHGGSVQAESDGEGTGSKFTVRLPLIAPQAMDGP